MTQAERISALETEVRLLKETLENMNRNLESLIALRNKGAGAFWLGTTLFGTTLIGFAYTLMHWFK